MQVYRRGVYTQLCVNVSVWETVRYGGCMEGVSNDHSWNQTTHTYINGGSHVVHLLANHTEQP